MAREYTPIPFEFLEELDGLSDEEYGRLIRAMQAYSIDGTEPDFDGVERLFWKRCRNTIDRFCESYEKRNKSNAENGAKGGRPKKDSVSEETQENPKNPMGFSETQNNPSVSEETQKSQSKTKTKAKTNIIPPISPKGTRRTDAEFETIWNAYPKKVGKQPARKAFDKVKVPIETLVAAIDRQKCSSQWSKDGSQYIPNLSTWLNQERWNDELPTGNEKPGWEDGRRQLDADEAAAIRRMMEEDSHGQFPTSGG